MRLYTLPPIWDAGKFAVRYNLDRDKDFYVDANGKLVVFPALPDDPPIFELPDPPVPQVDMHWEPSAVPGSMRLVATFNGRKSTIIGAVGADATLIGTYTSPGPMEQQAAGPRREFHVATAGDIGSLPVPPVDGDTLYVAGDGEYRHSNGAWRRVLYGPSLGTPADSVTPLYSLLNAAMDNAINPPIGPQIDARIKAVLVELRKLI